VEAVRARQIADEEDAAAGEICLEERVATGWSVVASAAAAAEFFVEAARAANGPEICEFGRCEDIGNELARVLRCLLGRKLDDSRGRRRPREFRGGFERPPASFLECAIKKDRILRALRVRASRRAARPY